MNMDPDSSNEQEKVRRLLLKKLSSRRETDHAEADAILDETVREVVDNWRRQFGPGEA